MSNFTGQQKKAFLFLSEKYDPAVYAIVARGMETEISVSSRDEAVLLDKFSEKICGFVINDYPDIDGDDEDINADAEMVVFMISDVLSDAGYEV
jgi:hypothetical protein